ncbi:MAG TPA: arylamine N-acetyltransferase [Ignavibacteriaceae bacterium]|nr:arylamine N-acetyltransferase [Ignavibacteriaceae bacterium]
MELQKYLNRINVTHNLNPDLDTLNLLHRQHLYNVPFENLDIHSGRKIILDTDQLLNKVVNEKRGGFCYELNCGFKELLTAGGYKVKYISAGVFSKAGKFSPDFDHMALIVEINNAEYLADVGFGDSFIEPLKFQLDIIQKDMAGYFKISESEEKGYFILFRSSDGNDFLPQYKFSVIPRQLKEYESMCEFNQTSPQSSFTQKVICSKATETGRISLSDLKLIVTEKGNKNQTEITEEEFHSLLNRYFGIKLNSRLIFPQSKPIPLS